MTTIDRHRDDPGHQRQRVTIVAAVRLGDPGLERAVVGGEEIAGLIDEGGDGRARRARRQFVEMGRDDAPGALDAICMTKAPSASRTGVDE